MLRSIHLENFFSFRDEKIQINADSNLLVGINGSGKSNLLKAVQLLSESMSEEIGFRRVFSRWGGFDRVVNFSGKPADYIRLTYEFDAQALRKFDPKGFLFHSNPFYKIEIHRIGNSAYFLSEQVYNKGQTGRKPFIYLQMENGRGVISERAENGPIQLKNWEEFAQQSEYTDPDTAFKGNELVLKQAANDAKRFFPLYSLKKAIEKIAVYSYFDTTDTSVLRQMGEYQPETQLRTDGSNLSQMFQRLSVNSPLVFDQTLTWLKKINPFFKDIRFDQLGPRFGLVLTEEKPSRSVTLDGISDGTLRFLIMLSILLNPERGKLICFDEPEIGLHPDMVSVLSSVINQANREGTQIIIATHSPMLLNMFELEQVGIVEKNDHNASVVSFKSEEEFAEWVGEFLPGKLWLQGLLGGRR